MDPSEERVSGEGNNNGADGSNLCPLPHSENKKVCRYCKREFKCGRGLGGHMKIHFKGQKMSKFTQTKMNKRRGCRSSAAPPPPRRDNNEVNGGVISDLSKSLFGSGWKVQKKRGTNDVRNKRVVIKPDNSSSDDDYVECDRDDSCDEDDYDNIRLRKRLRRRGFTSTAHKICWTRRVLMCKVCNQFFKTYYSVFRHMDEYAPTDSDVEENEEKGEEVGEGSSIEFDQVVDEEAAAEEHGGDAEECIEVGEKEEQGKADSSMGDNNEGSGGVGDGVGEKESNEVDDEVAEVDEKSGGGSKEQQVSTSVAPPKMRDFDLNEMPPEED